MTITEEPEETAEATPAAVPRVPRFGAGASGLVSLLLVAGVLVVPLFGLLIAPLGLVPVLHFQSDGSPGIRAWGWVAALLMVGAVVGFGPFPLALLAAYSSHRCDPRAVRRAVGQDGPGARGVGSRSRCLRRLAVVLVGTGGGDHARRSGGGRGRGHARSGDRCQGDVRRHGIRRRRDRARLRRVGTGGAVGAAQRRSSRT